MNVKSSNYRRIQIAIGLPLILVVSNLGLGSLGKHYSGLRPLMGEEVLFRGYPIERIEELNGSRWVAGIVSCAAFTYAHLSYWGGAQLVIAAFGGIVLTVLYVWRRDLPSNMLAHFIADGTGFLLR